MRYELFFYFSMELNYVIEILWNHSFPFPVNQNAR